MVEKEKGVLRVIAGSPDKPLELNGVEIQCYVLENEMRVLSQSRFSNVVGASRGGFAYSGAEVGGNALPEKGNSFANKKLTRGAKVPRFAAAGNLRPFIDAKLWAQLADPVRFRISSGLEPSYGYMAECLMGICDVFLEARQAGVLRSNQMPIAQRCEVLMRAFAHAGLVALVDERTGYQKMRLENALAEIAKLYIAVDPRPWVSTFPMKFYLQLCRLHGWPEDYATQRPHAVAQITNDVVYSRLAPGVLERLRAENPIVEGKRERKHHQHLTEDVGLGQLKSHLEGVYSLMRSSPTWAEFKSRLETVYPVRTPQGALEFNM